MKTVLFFVENFIFMYIKEKQIELKQLNSKNETISTSVKTINNPKALSMCLYM